MVHVLLMKAIMWQSLSLHSKLIWIYLVISDIQNTLNTFNNVTGIDRTRNKNVENKHDGHWPLCCRILIQLQFFFKLPVFKLARFCDGSFFLEISSLKTTTLYKVWHWPTCSRWSVTRVIWPDRVRSFWWKHNENLFNGVGDIRRFLSFSRWRNSTGKVYANLWGILHSYRTICNRPLVL